MEKDEWEKNFRLLEYYHRSMESRRSIALRVFIASVTLLLLLARATAEHLTHVNDLEAFKLLMQSVFVGIFVLYLFFQIQVESVNKRDRQKYHALQDALSPSAVNVETESVIRAVLHSWAATWSILTLLLMTIGCWFFVRALAK